MSDTRAPAPTRPNLAPADPTFAPAHPNLAPARPNLEFDKKQAKRLLRSIRQGDSEAIRRLADHHPRYRQASGAVVDAKLSDAQLVIAREYGHMSWPRWKRYVELTALDFDAQCNAFLEAACSGNMMRATALLELAPSIGEADIFTASAAGNAARVRALVERDQELAIRKGGALDWEPLLYACFSRFLGTDPERSRGIRDVVDALLGAGANANAFFLHDGEDDPEHRQTALYGAAGIANDPTLTAALLVAGADPADGVEAALGPESLYHAAEFADNRCLELILKAGPPAAAITFCLGRAVDFDNPEAMLLFLEHGADPNYATPWGAGFSHFMKAIRQRRELGVINSMLEHGAEVGRSDEQGLTPYRVAIRYGRADVAQLLIEHGADASEATPADRLIGACFEGSEVDVATSALSDADHSAVAYAAAKGNADAAARLLDAGLEIDVADDEGMTALHRACMKGHLDTARMLVERGASLTETHRYGGNALTSAMWGSLFCHDIEGGMTSRPAGEVEPRDYAEIVDFLLSAGAPKPQHAQASDAVIDVLLKHGMPVESSA